MLKTFYTQQNVLINGENLIFEGAKIFASSYEDARKTLDRHNIKAEIIGIAVLSVNTTNSGYYEYFNGFSVN